MLFSISYTTGIPLRHRDYLLLKRIFTFVENTRTSRLANIVFV